jgi:Zn-finger nucleic acid-binding protein
VWLDRGALDKIVERLAAPVRQLQPQQYAKRDRYAEQPQRKKRESFLGELFEF